MTMKETPILSLPKAEDTWKLPRKAGWWLSQARKQRAGGGAAVEGKQASPAEPQKGLGIGGAKSFLWYTELKTRRWADTHVRNTQMPNSLSSHHTASGGLWIPQHSRRSLSEWGIHLQFPYFSTAQHEWGKEKGVAGSSAGEVRLPQPAEACPGVPAHRTNVRIRTAATGQPWPESLTPLWSSTLQSQPLPSRQVLCTCDHPLCPTLPAPPKAHCGGENSTPVRLSEVNYSPPNPY